MITRLAVGLSLLLGLFAAGFWQGRSLERQAWESRAAALAAARDRAAARAQGLAEALQREQAAHAALARQLEEMADADDDADRIALPARSLQRIGAR